MVQIQDQEDLELLQARRDEQHARRRDDLQARLAAKELELQLLKQRLSEIEQDPNSQNLAERLEELVKERKELYSNSMAYSDKLLNPTNMSVSFLLSKEGRECAIKLDKTLDNLVAISRRVIALKAQCTALCDARLKVGFCKLAIESMKCEIKGLIEGRELLLE